jgi:hypothetical protein
MRATLLGVCLLVVTLAHGQTRMTPSDVDLKSAYCLRVKQLQQSFVNSTASAATSQTPEHQLLRKWANDHNSDVNRLQSYLQPKLSSLNSAALLAATRRADADMKENANTANVCSPKCAQFVQSGTLTTKWSSCMASCDAEYPARARVGACKVVNWLPV